MTTIAEFFTQKGEAQGEARGEARGITKALREMALKLLKKGMSINEIGELTGLPANEINN